MSTAILLLNFREPATPDREAVVSYLERIFFNNREIEGDTTEAEARERARFEYRHIPGASDCPP